MAISFTCPHCGNTTQVSEAYAGQSGPCAKCGATITVPGRGQGAPSSSGSKTILVVVAACVAAMLLCGGVMALLLYPAIGAAREAARRAECSNNLRQIGIALHNYHDVFNTLPPTFIPDANGQPMHSWRVLILPFIEQQYLHSAYNFDEPWNSSSNLAATDVVVPLYQCPADRGSSCNYFAVNVPDGIFDGAKANTFGNVTDGMANTLMIVEVAGSNIHWAEPQDLGPAALTMGVKNNASNGSGISSNHVQGAMILMGDGSVHMLDASTSQAVIQLLVTKSDGQFVTPY